MNCYPLYGGEVSLYFDDGAHAYYVTDMQCGLDYAHTPGVTSITKMIPKNMSDWGARMAMEEFVDSIAEGEVLTADRVCELQSMLVEAPRRRMDRLAAIGTEVHAYCEKHIRHQLGLRDSPPDRFESETDPSTFYRCVTKYHDWISSYQVEFLAAEKKVYHRTLRYAGTVDAIATVDGKKAIIDFKTRAYRTGGDFLQLAAYWMAYEREHGETFDCAMLVLLPRSQAGFSVASVSREQLTAAKEYYGHCEMFRLATEDYKRTIKSWRKGIKYL